MKLTELNELIDTFNDIRREIGQAKMAIDVGWKSLAEEHLNNAEKLMRNKRDQLVINKITDVLNNNLEEL